jgi:hypothetical protein
MDLGAGVLMNPDAAMTYLDFVCERHAIWWKRQRDAERPWTDDQVLRTRKFTNVFRVLDYGSQFVCKELLYDDSRLPPGDALMRTFLYRYTNRPEPWLAFKEEFGRMPIREDLERNLPDLWRDYRAGGYPVFGNAYKMFSGYENKGTDRLTWITELANRFFGFGDDDITEAFWDSPTPQARLDVLKTIPRCADFLGMQILTDIGYWDPHWDENNFIVPGPGARVGAKAIGMSDATEAIRWAHQALTWRDDIPLLPIGNRWREPSWMDVQNTFCEFGKYIRYRGKPTPTRGDYRPAHPGAQPAPFVPPHWKGTVR